MVDNYFKNVLKDLKGGNGRGKIKMDFVTLKSYEYWIRVLRLECEKPKSSDCLEILPHASSKRVISNVIKHFEKENEKDLNVIKRKKVRIAKKNGDNQRIFDSELDETSDLLERRKDAADAFKSCIKRSCVNNDIGRMVNRYLDGEKIFDDKTQKIFYEGLVAELQSQIETHAGNVADPYLKRLRKVQKIFGLSDAELEIVTFVWIFEEKNLCDELRFSRANYSYDCRDTVKNFLILYPDMDVGKMLSDDSTLKMMNILDDDLDLSSRVMNFLNGRCGNNLDSLYYKVYKGKCVPYQELCRDNDKVKLMFEMIKNNPVGCGLNIFFYGVEGTGKTELAKAVAHELKVPLVMIAIDTDGENKRERKSSTISERMGSILFAARKYKDQKAILLVDEADLILNACEKGALNIFLERINVPVIWISNDVRWIEPSSLRRFDYSIEFDRPDAEKRHLIWKSVIKEQHAKRLLSDDTVKRFADEFTVTAGGITQAVTKVKNMLKNNGKADVEKLVREMLCAQSDLMRLPREFYKRDSDSHAPSYVLDVLNTDVDLEHIQHVIQMFDARWKLMKENDKPDSLNILFYGVPGTGKTELAKYIARSLKRKLLIKKASDLLDCYVGETEQKIRKMFREAEDKKAILFLDEADSMIRDRSGADHSWEVTQVNELLTQMENFKGIFIAATNFNDNLDQASRRRFALKVKFNYLKPEGIRKMWQAFFPQVECPDAACEMKMLAPGDFNAAYGTLRFVNAEELTAEKIMQCLKQETSFKDDREGRRMGF